jgi:hypothetical protein
MQMMGMCTMKEKTVIRPNEEKDRQCPRHTHTHTNKQTNKQTPENDVGTAGSLLAAVVVAFLSHGVTISLKRLNLHPCWASSPESSSPEAAVSSHAGSSRHQSEAIQGRAVWAARRGIIMMSDHLD